MKRAVAEISLSALHHNFNLIRSAAGSAEIFGVIKANAYGHGAVAIAEFLEGCGVNRFAVATVAEAVELRLAGIKSYILILGYTPISEAHLITEYGLTQSLISPKYARELALWCGEHRAILPVHIKVDTGMNRLGFDCGDFEGILKVCTTPCYKIEGIFSHFPSVDDENKVDFSNSQYEMLKRLVSRLSSCGVKIPLYHIANSVATFKGGYACDAVRPGIALYGYGVPGLRPAMTLKSHVCNLHTVRAGDAIGYSGVFVAKRDMRVATVPLGYADGIRRDFGRLGISVLVGGREAKCIGNVCMDYFMLDVTDITGVELGTEVVIFGDIPNHTADDIATALGTIAHEVLTSVSERVERKIVP